MLLHAATQNERSKLPAFLHIISGFPPERRSQVSLRTACKAIGLWSDTPMAFEQV